MASLSRILSGRVNPSLTHMIKISQALDTSIDVLAGHTPLSAIDGDKNSNLSAQQQVFGRRKTDVSQETDVLAYFIIEDSDLKPEDAKRLLSDAANGSWVHSWTDALVADDSLRRPYAVDAKKIGTRRLAVTMAFPHDYIEEGSTVSLISVLGAALTGTHARIADVRIPPVLIRTFKGPAFGIRGLRDRTNKYGRPLLSATLRPMLGLPPRIYARTAYETLRGGVDITCDPTLLHSVPQSSWRERFTYMAEAVLNAQEETNEQKCHVVNITAPTVEETLIRAEHAQKCGLTTVLIDSAAMGWSGVESVARWCRTNNMLLFTMGGRSLQSMIMSEQVIAKLLRLSGADVVSMGSPLRGGIANRRYVKGVIRAIGDHDFSPFPEGGQVFDQPTCGLPAAMPACGGGHNPWHFPRLIDAFGNNVIIQCGGSVMGHPWGGTAGSVACRVAVEACVRAMGEGLNLNVDGRNILIQAAKYNNELKTALEHWQEGAFLFGVIPGQNRGPIDAHIVSPISHLHSVSDNNEDS